MANRDARKRKANLSDHQKQIRFLTGVAVIVGFLLVGLIFWLLNRSSFSTASIGG